MKIKKGGQLKSLDEVRRDGWAIKLSILNDQFVLCVIRSEATGQTIVRYFDDEQEVADFVEFVCELNAIEEHDI